MSDNQDALRLADALEQQFPIGTAQHHLDGEAAAELRRLAAENKLLNAELNEQARLNVMGSEREVRLMDKNKELREANEAFGKRQEWWNEKMVALEAINAELVEALRHCRDMVEHPDNLAFIDAALAKVEASK